MAPLFALLLAAAPPSAGAASTPVASMRVTVRIVRASASVGPTLVAPRDAQRREAQVSAADGSPAPAILYEFE